MDEQQFTIGMDQSIPSIEKKGVAEVLSTETISLQALRHTLRGLGSDEILEKFLPMLQDKDVDTANYIDFLELSQKVAPEHRQEFEEMLESYNRQRQQEIETRGIEGTRQKWKALYDKKLARVQKDRTRREGFAFQRTLSTLLFEWNELMYPIIKKELDLLNQIRKYPSVRSVPAELQQQMTDSITLAERFEYAPYLCGVRAESLAPITILEILRLNSTGGVSEGMRTARALLSVGKAVETEYRMTMAKHREREVLKGFNGADANPETIEQVKTAVKQSDLVATSTSWSPAVRARVGSFLVSVLLQVAKVPVEGKDPITGEIVKGEAPAFYHTYQYHNGSRLGVIKVHRVVGKKLSTDTLATVIQPQQLPMLVKPVPWSAFNKGGYLYTATKIMRTKDSPEQVAYLQAASKVGAFDKVYEGLNVLGSTAWTINRNVFQIILKVWNTGEEFLDIPKLVDPKPEFPPAPPRNADPAERTAYLRKCRQMVLENNALYAQRCDASYKIEIARAFLGERFYMPHNIDFRGRAYPLTPHLNHLGNDLARGLMKFWEGRELGEKGLDWLKIHCANLFGHNKVSLEDRKKFIDERMDLVLDSANHPLDGKGWWKEAESPWQTLAVCMEIRDALASGDPTKFCSRIPVHQDGSCNGLQHYAALGGDIEGAHEVNLTPSERPQDVYSRVLEIVKERIREDANKGDAAAKLVVDKLTRKVVKQTVMTHVYGVTFVGARKQIAGKLGEFDELDRRQLYSASAYVAGKVLGAVKSLFTCAHEIQDWLGENAARISKSVRLDVKPSSKKHNDYMSSVIWTTPLGLPIVQPYREESKHQVKTAMQSVFIADPYGLRTVNARKQRTAFPPNFVHSLDATHMLMSAIGCSKEGLTFAAVHDSYWTHAGTVDTMNKILRQSFIDLHKVDIVTKLKDEFIQRYRGLYQVVNISTETEVGKKILELHGKYSRDRFGRKRRLGVAELLEIEQERQEALKRGMDPAHYVTPVSVMEDLSDEELKRMTVEEPKRAMAFKSTEHEGSGADMFEQAEEVMDNERAKENTKSIVALVPLRIPDVPRRGNFDISQVSASEYFFS